MRVNQPEPQSAAAAMALRVSPLDERTYRAFTLSNQLDVLIASDTHSDKAAAGLDVAVGHFSDPDNLPGLAHFLEHMLFLGTEKYPEEGSYNRFLAENGGQSNAYTSRENTNYHFEMVISDHTNAASSPNVMPRFKEALDRFAQFFTAPLFTESATERELNAVDSEHQKNLQSDRRRIFQLTKTSANANHPYSKFGSGSMQTLRTIPKQNGIDTRAALLNFYKKYYSANLMKLCIIGPYDLDLMQQWVEELFSSIRNHDAPNPCEQYRQISPLLPEHRAIIYHMETIRDVMILDLSWPTPTYIDHYRSKPGSYVANLLGDEGEGSILSILKAHGWADRVGAIPSDAMTFGLFQMSITLTREGIDHIDDIISIIYGYISMARAQGIQKWIFDEEAALAQMSFRFREREEPFSFVTRTASQMHIFPPHDYLCGSEIVEQFDPTRIAEILDMLTPENSIVLIAGKFVADKTNMKERWYETPYSLQPIGEERMQKWRAARCHPDLRIPTRNPFIPTNYDVLGKPLPQGQEDKEGPRRILRNQYMDVYHKLDRTFNRPKATVACELRTPYTYQSPWHSTMTKLFTALLEDALTEYSYAAEKAGLSYRLSQCTGGIRLYLEGYNHKIGVLLKAVVEKIVSFKADAIRFEMVRDSAEREYVNFDKGQPYSHAMYAITCLVEEPRWHIAQYLECLRNGSITIEAMHAFTRDIQRKMFMLGLVAGNVSEEEAVSMMTTVHSTLKYAPFPEVEHQHRRVVQLPSDKEIFVRKVHPNLDDNNSAIEVFFQTGLKGDFVADVKLELIADILNKPAFHELRTVQQLGYMVFEGYGESENVRGLFLVIQSTVADPDELLRRIDTFLVDVRRDTIEPMTDEKFQDYVSALVAKKAEPEKELWKQSARFFWELQSGYQQYDRAEKEIEVLATVSKEQVTEFFDKHIALGGAERRRVVSQVYGNQHPISKKEVLPQGAVEVRDVFAFRKQNVLYPVGGRFAPEQDRDIETSLDTTIS